MENRTLHPRFPRFQEVVEVKCIGFGMCNFQILIWPGAVFLSAEVIPRLALFRRTVTYGQ